MVEILCPHCDEEIGLDDDAVGEFSCPLCDGGFTWGALFDEEEEEDDSADFFAWKSFWIGFGITYFALGIPLLFLVVLDYFSDLFSFIWHDDEELLFLLLLIPWIALMIKHAFSIRNKAMWLGILAGILVVPLVFVVWCFGYLWYYDGIGYTNV